MSKDSKTKAITALSSVIDLDDQLFSPVLSIIYHPDAERIGERVLLHELLVGEAIILSRLSPQFRSKRSGSQSLDDLHISRKPIEIRIEQKSELLIKSPREGSELSINGELVVGEFRCHKNMLESGVVLKLAGRVVLLLHETRIDTQPAPQDYGLLGNSYNINQVRHTIAKVQDLDVSVLIRGESGTGKELVAQAIHHNSSRKEGPLVSINMAAIPSTLAVAELFGAKKGAYTGATKDKTGYFEQAHGGTLFLDEVGDAGEEVQAILLRSLETREILPVGAAESVAIDIRLIAATDADLDKMIRNEEFRTPLLQRLAGFEIRIAALRKRKEDIGVLFHTFLQRELEGVGESLQGNNNKMRIYFWASVFEKACQFDWPGNVRQLNNVSQQIVIQNRGANELELPDNVKEMFTQDRQGSRPIYNTLESELMSKKVLAYAESASADSSGSVSIDEEATVALVVKHPVKLNDQEFADVLKSVNWDVSKAAEVLKLSRAALYKRIEKHPTLRKAGDIAVEELRSCFDEADRDISKMVDRLKVSESALKRRLKELDLVL